MPRKRKAASDDSKMNIVKGFTLFAQNLPIKKTAAHVQHHFSKYGRVVACHVSEGKDVYQGARKNSALVTFECEEDLTKALNATHVMDSRRILTSRHVPSKKEKISKPSSEVAPTSKKTVITPAQVPLIMDGNPTIFVFGLGLTTPKAHVVKYFSDFGDVADCDLPLEEPDVNKGYCYIRFASVKSVIKVMQQKFLRLDNKFLSVLPSVTENKWSSWAPVIEKVDVRSKSQKREDKKKEKEAIRKEMEEAAAAALKKRNETLRSQILAKRAETGGALSADQIERVKSDPVVVLEGLGVQAGVKAVTKCAQGYGSVRHVHIPTDKYLKDKGIAYVHFSQASHALKLLELPYVDIDNVCVEVRPVRDDEEKVEAHAKERTGLEANGDEYKIYVGGLDSSVVAREVYGHFAVYGAVTNVDLPRTRKKKSAQQNRGFAFVTFANKESLDSALAVPEHKIKFKRVNVYRSDPNCTGKRKLKQEAATSEEPCSKKARRQAKKALREQSLGDNAPSDQESGESASESEDDDKNLLSSDDEQ